MNDMKEWAKREIELATAGEDFEMKESIDKHYEAAYLAFCDCLDRIEDLDKPGITKTILNQLLIGNVLTPIEDKEDEWEFAEGFDPSARNDNPGFTIYRSKRRPSLFKNVIYDRKTGEVDKIKYADSERYTCIDINTENYYSGGMGLMVLNEEIPITFPYFPIGKIRIFTEDFKCHEDFDGDFDTVGVLYFRMPDGRMKEAKRFFKEDYKTHEMIEINATEYLARKKKSEGSKKKKI